MPTVTEGRPLRRLHRVESATEAAVEVEEEVDRNGTIAVIEAAEVAASRVMTAANEAVVAVVAASVTGRTLVDEMLESKDRSNPSALVRVRCLR